jgi:hypothetical protein
VYKRQLLVAASAFAAICISTASDMLRNRCRAGTDKSQHKHGRETPKNPFVGLFSKKHFSPFTAPGRFDQQGHMTNFMTCFLPEFRSHAKPRAACNKPPNPETKTGHHVYNGHLTSRKQASFYLL